MGRQFSDYYEMFGELYNRFLENKSIYELAYETPAAANVAHRNLYRMRDAVIREASYNPQAAKYLGICKRLVISRPGRGQVLSIRYDFGPTIHEVDDLAEPVSKEKEQEALRKYNLLHDPASRRTRNPYLTKKDDEPGK